MDHAFPCYGVAPVIDLEKIDWNSVTDTKSLFESVLDMLKSKDEESMALRKDIEQLKEEAEAFSGEHAMLTEMDARIKLLEEENVQKDSEIEQKDSEIEKLRAENAALLQGCDVSQAVMDRIARLERQASEHASQLREARAANSALAAENLGIKSRRSQKRLRESPGPAPDPFRKVVCLRTGRDPPPISEKKLVDMPACPHGHALSKEPTEVTIRVVEEIIDGKLTGIQYTVVRRYCRECGRQFAPEIPGVVPGGRFGASLTCLETTMRMYNIPYEPIRKLINIIYHTDLAKSTVIGHVDAVTGSLHPLYEEMLEEIFFSEHVFGDETSWRVAGVLYWLWILVGDNSTVFYVDKRRGGDVLETLLGGYAGHVTSDSHSAWNRIGRTHQKCHYHYLREIIRTLTMKNPGPEFKKFAKALKGIIIDSWHAEKGLNPNDDAAARNLKVRNLLARVRRLMSGSYTEPHCKRFVKRLRREITHLFPFIRLSTKCHNNDAERPLRPSVASRKVSGGSKSLAGAYNHAVLASIRETCRMRGVNPHDFLVDYMRGMVEKIPAAAAAGSNGINPAKSIHGCPACPARPPQHRLPDTCQAAVPARHPIRAQRTTPDSTKKGPLRKSDHRIGQNAAQPSLIPARKKP